MVHMQRVCNLSLKMITKDFELSVNGHVGGGWNGHNKQ